MDMAIGILVGLTFGGILMYWGEKTSDKVINELTEKLTKAYDETGEVADKWKAAVDSLNNYWKDCYSLDQVLEMENKWVAEVDDLKEELENTEDLVTQMRTDSKKEFKRTRAAYDYYRDNLHTYIAELENRVSEEVVNSAKAAFLEKKVPFEEVA